MRSSSSARRAASGLPLSTSFVLLGVGLGDDLVAFHRHREDGIFVAEEAILAEDADARRLGDVDRALGGRVVTGDDLEERRLARAVGADQTVTRAADQLERHVLEEDACAIGFPQIGDVDHGRTRSSGRS